MVNPLLTVLFNLFLVGSALAVLAAMIQEYLDSRRPAIGGRATARGGEATAVQLRQRRTSRRAA
jgi:hypothetical protein